MPARSFITWTSLTTTVHLSVGRKKRRDGEIGESGLKDYLGLSEVNVDLLVLTRRNEKEDINNNNNSAKKRMMSILWSFSTSNRATKRHAAG